MVSLGFYHYQPSQSQKNNNICMCVCMYVFMPIYICIYMHIVTNFYGWNKKLLLLLLLSVFCIDLAPSSLGPY